jgi:hypothetical protein
LKRVEAFAGCSRWSDRLEKGLEKGPKKGLEKRLEKLGLRARCIVLFCGEHRA